MPPQCAGMLKNIAVFCPQKLKPPKVFLECVGPPSPPGSVIDSGNVSVRFPGGKQPFWLAEDGFFKFGEDMHMRILCVHFCFYTPTCGHRKRW